MSRGQQADAAARDCRRNAVQACEQHRFGGLCRPSTARDERSELVGELQESILQQIYGMSLMSKGCIAAAAAGRPVDFAGFCNDASAVCRQTLRELFLLIAQDHLRSTACLDLVEALETRLALVEERAGIRASLEVTGPILLEEGCRAQIYHIAEDLLNISLLRGGTTSVEVELVTLPESTTLSVEDDVAVVGAEQSYLSAVPDRTRARIALVGAKIRLRTPPGKGTRVEVTLGNARNVRLESSSSKPQVVTSQSDGAEPSAAPGQSMDDCLGVAGHT